MKQVNDVTPKENSNVDQIFVPIRKFGLCVLIHAHITDRLHLEHLLLHTFTSHIR